MRPLLELYVDGELDAAAGLEVERHLEACPECARERQQLLLLRQALRADVPRFAAPARLRSNVRNAVRRAAHPRFAVPPVVWPWLTAASLILGVGGVFVGWYGLRSAPSPADQLAQQVVANHARSLQPGHLLDKVSEDRHVVKPWFADKVPYPPPVFDLEKQGFKLAGGRLDYLNQRAVAALVYERRLHKINLFVWPDDGAAPAAGSREVHGFHLVPFRHRGMTGWAVSDLETSELQEFIRFFQEAMDR
jgi:anti-sigma factor RsiW